jgi:hypothetical protein
MNAAGVPRMSPTKAGEKKPTIRARPPLAIAAA